jgi:hypothetical protein
LGREVEGAIRDSEVKIPEQERWEGEETVDIGPQIYQFIQENPYRKIIYLSVGIQRSVGNIGADLKPMLNHVFGSRL